MKHRDAADTKRYRMLAEKFIQKYGIDTSEYDIILWLESQRILLLYCKRVCEG